MMPITGGNNPPPNRWHASPSQGPVHSGWEGSFEVGGRAIALHDSLRFDNPYSQCAFGAEQVTIRRGEETLVLDLGPLD